MGVTEGLAGADIMGGKKKASPDTDAMGRILAKIVRVKEHHILSELYEQWAKEAGAERAIPEAGLEMPFPGKVSVATFSELEDRIDAYIASIPFVTERERVLRDVTEWICEKRHFNEIPEGVAAGEFLVAYQRLALPKGGRYVYFVDLYDLDAEVFGTQDLSEADAFARDNAPATVFKRGKDKTASEVSSY